MIRTAGAAFGALLFVLFMNQMATPTPVVTVSWYVSAVVTAQR